jgi:hypothetical protein
MSNIYEVIKRLKSFIDETDISMENAGHIESLLDELYPEDEMIQDFVTHLASYKPGGGEYLYDKNQIIKYGKNVLEHIENDNESAKQL